MGHLRNCLEPPLGHLEKVLDVGAVEVVLPDGGVVLGRCDLILMGSVAECFGKLVDDVVGLKHPVFDGEGRSVHAM